MSNFNNLNSLTVKGPAEFLGEIKIADKVLESTAVELNYLHPQEIEEDGLDLLARAHDYIIDDEYAVSLNNKFGFIAGKEYTLEVTTINGESITLIGLAEAGIEDFSSTIRVNFGGNEFYDNMHLNTDGDPELGGSTWYYYPETAVSKYILTGEGVNGIFTHTITRYKAFGEEFFPKAAQDIKPIKVQKLGFIIPCISEGNDHGSGAYVAFPEKLNLKLGESYTLSVTDEEGESRALSGVYKEWEFEQPDGSDISVPCIVYAEKIPIIMNGYYVDENTNIIPFEGYSIFMTLAPEKDSKSILFGINEDGTTITHEEDQTIVLPVNISGEATTLTGLTTTIEELNFPVGRVAEGENSEIFNDYEDNKAIGEYSHAEGRYSTATGKYSHTEGYRNEAFGDDSHAEGQYTRSIGEASHSEGYRTGAVGMGAHSEGYSMYEKTIEFYRDKTDSEILSSFEAGGNWRFSLARGLGAHTEGSECLALGEGAHAEGRHSYAVGLETHAEGSAGATGSCSHAEGNSKSKGIMSHAEGYNTVAKGKYSHSEGAWGDAIGDYSHSQNYFTEAHNFASTSLGKNNKQMTAGDSELTQIGDVLVIGNGTGGTPSNAFRVTYTGATYGLTAFNSSGADYAEFVYPWYDDNIDNEDRIGYFVTFKDGKLHKATSKDIIIGVTSGNPSVVGNADEDYYWRYERDSFNRIVFEDVEEEVQKVDEEGNPVFDENGKPVLEKTGNIIKNGRMKLSEKYDQTLQDSYIERKNRQEWDYVGMLGVIPVRDDGTCIPGQYCKCNDDGIATLATTEDVVTNRFTYTVLERTSDSVIKILMAVK